MLLCRFRLCTHCPWVYKPRSRWSASYFLSQLYVSHHWAQKARSLVLHGWTTVNVAWAQAAYRPASPSGTLCQGPSTKDPCQPTRICAYCKYARKELVELGSLLSSTSAFGTASTFNTFLRGFFTSTKQWTSCMIGRFPQNKTARLCRWL